jgi:hypothetical protein
MSLSITLTVSTLALSAAILRFAAGSPLGCRRPVGGNRSGKRSSHPRRTAVVRTRLSVAISSRIGRPDIVETVHAASFRPAWARLRCASNTASVMPR